VGTVDQLVKDEIQRAVQKQALLLADDMVKAAVGQTVEQAVQRIVPEIAEQHIKAELKRLIETEEASHPSTI
jgi:enhancing lycopene biosynthesis protein 2